MTQQTKLTRVAAAVVFSLIMGALLALTGCFLGMYLWGHFGAAPRDETDAYFCGLLTGGIMGIVGGTTLLWKFWPRTTTADPKPRPR
jgi:hypothetical protein